MVFREGSSRDLSYGLAKMITTAESHDSCHHLARIRQLIGSKKCASSDQSQTTHTAFVLERISDSRDVRDKNSPRPFQQSVQDPNPHAASSDLRAEQRK